jgi:hypothetical protein
MKDIKQIPAKGLVLLRGLCCATSAGYQDHLVFILGRKNVKLHIGTTNWANDHFCVSSSLFSF